MKTYKQRAESVQRKLEQKKRNRNRAIKAALAGAGCIAFTAVNLVLFMPFSTTPPDVSGYADSEYYAVISRLNAITYQKPVDKNNFEKWFGGFDGLFGCGAAGDANMGMDMANGMDSTLENAGDYYVETTDNQVAGVIEGDLIKRTGENIFYLRETGEGLNLSVYSIDKARSALISDYTVTSPENGWFMDGAEMYLSADGDTVTLLAESAIKAEGSGYAMKRFVTLISLDVSDEAQVKETARVYFSGSYNTSRYVDGKFIVVSEFTVNKNPDFDEPAEYLPQYGTEKNMQSVAAADIYSPDTLTHSTYTFVATVDGETLRTLGTTAFLSYSDQVYASNENVFVTRGYTQTTDLNNGQRETLSQTEISCVSYAGETPQYKGSFVVDGSVKNQYSMDEYQGVLRVVTTYSRIVREEVYYGSGDNAAVGWRQVSSEKNASLFCIDLSTREWIASVEKFAPEGETAESVRFNGDKAYVCTAEIVVLTDPVFAFDLSDLSNITYTDTGTIEGYSTSLIDFGNGYLVGIGYSDFRWLKIEVYAETETDVRTVGAWEARSASFSEDYKSYLIDRKNGLIGIGINDNSGYGSTGMYVLIGIDDQGGLTELAAVEMDGENAKKRGAYIDGYLYVFGETADGFAVEKVG
ncbi:MAG: beta-propeller domain-containing protein [Clostridia bacterium]|nr:beta-propeller domain-containing protein [Clostridia bacterium]